MSAAETVLVDIWADYEGCPVYTSALAEGEVLGHLVEVSRETWARWSAAQVLFGQIEAEMVAAVRRAQSGERA